MLRTILAILFISNSAFAMDTLMPVIFLDDVVISEENNGFTVEDFVRYVKNDTTFYMGFKHLRYYTHDFATVTSLSFTAILHFCLFNCLFGLFLYMGTNALPCLEKNG